MRKNDFLPRLAAAAIIITVLTISFIAEAQSIDHSSVGNNQFIGTELKQDTWHNENHFFLFYSLPLKKQDLDIVIALLFFGFLTFIITLISKIGKNKNKRTYHRSKVKNLEEKKG